MRHIIKKQILEFHVNDKLDAFRMQQDMSDYNTKVLLPLLEKIMNELSVEDEIIELDKIELDLGLLQLKELEKATTVSDLFETIRSKIKDAIRQSGTQYNSGQTKKPLRVARQWLFYMQRGYLDWSMNNVSEDWYDEVLQAFAVDFDSVTGLRQLILYDNKALKRIVYQHSDHFLVKLTEILTAVNQNRLTYSIDELYEIAVLLYQRQTKTPAASIKEIRKIIWQMALTIAAPAGRKSTTTEIVKKILKKFVNDPVTAQVIIKELAGRIAITGQLLQELLNEQDITLQRESSVQNIPRIDDTERTLQTDDKIENLRTKVTEPGKKEPQTPENLFTNDNTAGKEIEKIFAAKEDDKIAGAALSDNEEIFTGYAGLVLLHPFIPAFFRRLQLIDDTKFISDNSQQKAVCLLHYLATGEIFADEYKLVIPKLLCAFPFSYTLEKDIEINGAEVSEAENLLQAVIEQWSVLKNTSAQGLREGFLQRGGKLYSKNESLYLQVETRTIDVLLNYLPWNLTIIKLPWMKDLLKVDWR